MYENNYHLKFSKIDAKTVAATKALWIGWSRTTDGEKMARMNEWVAKVAAVYNMRAPKIELVPNHFSGSGCYTPATNTITLVKYSIMTLLHEFRHAMQRQLGGSGLRMFSGVEPDARAWSSSLYFAVAPNTYRRLVESGAFFFS